MTVLEYITDVTSFNRDGKTRYSSWMHLIKAENEGIAIHCGYHDTRNAAVDACADTVLRIERAYWFVGITLVKRDDYDNIL